MSPGRPARRNLGRAPTRGGAMLAGNSPRWPSEPSESRTENAAAAAVVAASNDKLSAAAAGSSLGAEKLRRRLPAGGAGAFAARRWTRM